MGNTNQLLDEAVEEELESAGSLVPPWVKFPHISRTSIGWRMGQGEWYMWKWMRWRDTYEVDWLAYWSEHEPIPFFWADYVLSTLSGEGLSGEATEQEIADAVRDLGFEVQSKSDGFDSLMKKRRATRRRREAGE